LTQFAEAYKVIDMSWHPRGEPTWPNWKSAEPGTRFEHVRSGRRGTFIKVDKNRNNGAVVEWDDVGFGVRRTTVIAPAFDLRPVCDEDHTEEA
jgi:hypothetical protein